MVCRSMVLRPAPMPVSNRRCGRAGTLAAAPNPPVILSCALPAVSLALSAVSLVLLRTLLATCTRIPLNHNMEIGQQMYLCHMLHAVVVAHSRHSAARAVPA